MARTIALTLLASLALAASAAAMPPDDPLFKNQWGPQQVRAPQAWKTSTGAGTIIGVVDTGVDFDHPDLKAKLRAGATFLECVDPKSGLSGETPCGKGDWESGPENRQESKSTHGTHVSGIAAASTGNRIGIAGVAPGAKILPVKVLDGLDGTFTDIGLGIRYAVDRGADVINLSLGALPGVQVLVITGLIDDMRRAVAYARQNDVVVVAAADNYYASICSTPAFEEGALCVASTDERKVRSAFSNFAVNRELDAVAAPGGTHPRSTDLVAMPCDANVLSTVPVGFGSGTSVHSPNYDEYAGTSMATPHVAGVAALLAAQGRSDDNIMEVLKSTARNPVTGMRGVYDPVYGYGIVDAEAAVSAPAG